MNVGVAARTPLCSPSSYQKKAIHALTGWKPAVMMEASYRRHLEGDTDHPQYADLAWRIPALVEQSARAMRGELGI